MIRPGQKILSILLLLPILTILAHNSIAHHHHASPVEVCCDNQQNNGAAGHVLQSSGPSAGSHHDACSFNPEFTSELVKMLVATVGSEPAPVACPLKWIESGHSVCVGGDLPGKPGRATYLLRGPPATA
jgi:hypothetical protein